MEQRSPQRTVPGQTVSQQALTLGLPHHVEFDARGSTTTATDNSTWQVLGWSGTPNRVELNWTDLSELGSGPVHVTIHYKTQGYTLDGVFHPGVDAQQLASYDSGADIGASVSWAEDNSPDGGIASITSVVLEKQDVQGHWVVVANRNNPGSYGQVLQLPAPNDGVVGALIVQVHPPGHPDDWQTVPAVNFGNQLRLDITGFGEGTWGYRLQRGGTTIAGSSGSFQGGVTSTGQTASHVVRPTIVQTVDRWGNVLSRSDARNASWITSFEYNANNQVVTQTQPADALLGTPVTRTFYDALGHQVAVRDANGHVNAQVFDAGGNLVEEHHADGGTVVNRYDAFGDRTATVDAMGHATTFTYDKASRVLSASHEAVAVYRTDLADDDGGKTLNLSFVGAAALSERNTYDQAGRKVSQTNTAGETTQYRYDLAGNVIEVIDPLGRSTKTAYDAAGHKSAEVDANGFGMSWTYDGFGRLQAHVDLGGARFSYTYDSAQQLIQQKSTRGQDLAYVYDAAGQQVEVDDYSGPQNDPGFVGPRFPSQITRYQYNEIGQRTLEQIRRGGDIFQDNHLRYDALGRLSSVDDTHMHIGIEYDLLGNRTRISTHVNIPVAAGSAEDKAFNTDRFFRYDEMNRQVLVDGVGIEENGAFARDALGHYRADITLGQGQILTYDLNGNRLSELKGGKRITESAGAVQGYHAYTMDGSTRLYITEHEGGAPTLFPPSDIGTDANGATYIISLSHSDGDGLAAFYVFVEPVGSAPTYAVTERQVQDTYQYDAMNRLTSIKHDGVTVDQRFYDAAGRTVQQGTGEAVTHEYIAALEPGNASNPATQATGLDADTRRYRYDAAGQLLQQRQFTTLQKNSSSLLGKPSEYEFRRYLGTDYTYDAVGNVIHFSFEKRWTFTNFYDYTSYKRFDTYAADTLEGKSTELLDRNTRNTYDANGRLVSYNNAGVERTLVNDQQGQVVHVVENGQAQRQVVAMTR